jgi:hypothetical protein
MGTRLAKTRDIVNQLKKSGFDLATLPATNELRKYDEWASDPTKRERADGTVPASGDKVKVGIVAFGIKTASDAKIEIKIGQRAKTKVTSLADVALFGHTDTLTDYKPMTGFVPAKCIIGTKVAPTSQTSEITGKKYKSRTGQTYTIPFGQNGTNTTEFDAQEALIEAASVGVAHSITFTPERMRRV